MVSCWVAQQLAEQKSAADGPHPWRSPCRMACSRTLRFLRWDWVSYAMYFASADHGETRMIGILQSTCTLST